VWRLAPAKILRQRLGDPTSLNTPSATMHAMARSPHVNSKFSGIFQVFRVDTFSAGDQLPPNTRGRSTGLMKGGRRMAGAFEFLLIPTLVLLMLLAVGCLFIWWIAGRQ